MSNDVKVTLAPLTGKIFFKEGSPKQQIKIVGTSSTKSNNYLYTMNNKECTHLFEISSETLFNDYVAIKPTHVITYYTIYADETTCPFLYQLPIEKFNTPNVIITISPYNTELYLSNTTMVIDVMKMLNDLQRYPESKLSPTCLSSISQFCYSNNIYITSPDFNLAKVFDSDLIQNVETTFAYLDNPSGINIDILDKLFDPNDYQKRYLDNNLNKCSFDVIKSNNFLHLLKLDEQILLFVLNLIPINLFNKTVNNHRQKLMPQFKTSDEFLVYLGNARSKDKDSDDDDCNEGEEWYRWYDVYERGAHLINSIIQFRQTFLPNYRPHFLNLNRPVRIAKYDKNSYHKLMKNLDLHVKCKCGKISLIPDASRACSDILMLYFPEEETILYLEYAQEIPYYIINSETSALNPEEIMKFLSSKN